MAGWSDHVELQGEILRVRRSTGRRPAGCDLRRYVEGADTRRPGRLGGGLRGGLRRGAGRARGRHPVRVLERAGRGGRADWDVGVVQRLVARRNDATSLHRARRRGPAERGRRLRHAAARDWPRGGSRPQRRGGRRHVGERAVRDDGVLGRGAGPRPAAAGRHCRSGKNLGPAPGGWQPADHEAGDAGTANRAGGADGYARGGHAAGRRRRRHHQRPGRERHPLGRGRRG